MNDVIFRRLGLAPLQDTSPGPHVRILVLTAFSGTFAFGLYSKAGGTSTLEVAWTNNAGPWDVRRALIQSEPLLAPGEPGSASQWEDLADLIDLSDAEGAELCQAASWLDAWPPVEGGYDGYILEFERRGESGLAAFHAWCPEEESHPGLMPLLWAISRLASTRTTMPELARRLATLHDSWFRGQPPLAAAFAERSPVGRSRRRR